jgi:hypothetical protein
MYDSLIARISAFGLAGIVSLSILAGIQGLASRENTAPALARLQQHTQPLMVAASAAQAERI